MRPTLLLCLLALASCGALPQPFFGNPGRNGARLTAPPPSRLAIPTPSQSLLDDAGSASWAEATATTLADIALPASHSKPQPGDWTLDLSATIKGDAVTPAYTILDSRGASQGSTNGPPVAAQLWSQNDPSTLKTAAQQAAPGIDALLTRIQAARLHDDPNSLQNRPAKVYLAGVTGAPGDGNRSLAAQMQTKLANLGIVVQDTVTGADYKLRCEVTTAPEPAGQVRIELQWVVDDARGERGRVVQLNEVAANLVDRYWGDVAVAAAEQAAGGIKEVLFNAAGPRLPAANDAKSPPKPADQK